MGKLQVALVVLCRCVISESGTLKTLLDLFLLKET